MERKVKVNASTWLLGAGWGLWSCFMLCLVLWPAFVSAYRHWQLQKSQNFRIALHAFSVGVTCQWCADFQLRRVARQVDFWQLFWLFPLVSECPRIRWSDLGLRSEYPRWSLHSWLCCMLPPLRLAWKLHALDQSWQLVATCPTSRSVWKKLYLEKAEEYQLVMEDDVKFCDNFF